MVEKNKTLSELFHSKDYLDREEKFKNGLQLIEEKNIDFFNKRKSVLRSQSHDRITNHILTSYNGGTKMLGFSTKELPTNIQDEVVKLFNDVWQPEK